jgi:hypothetical protein
MLEKMPVRESISIIQDACWGRYRWILVRLPIDQVHYFILFYLRCSLDRRTGGQEMDC